MAAKSTAKKKSPPLKTAKGKKSTSSDGATKNSGCPIVGIGASAGGFEAIMELLRALSPKTGMAFVIVQHLDPHHTSRLPDLLAKVTPMAVKELTGRTQPKPNAIYVQPPDKCVVCKDGTLALVGRVERITLAIDHFFESLAEAQGPRAIGVVLSGSGSDGTAGLRAIKAAGGLTFAQDEESAKYPSMPRNAVQSGFVDAALTPPEIAKEIKRIADHPYIQQPDGDHEELFEHREKGMDAMHKIFLVLKKATGVDFSSYKQSTLNRRIQRRMALHRVERMEQYVKLLKDNSKEVNELFNDLLINVTRFFRDERAFRALRKRFIPALMKQKRRKGELRIWVPGCATGEEVYSLAIVVLETLGNAASSMRIQIFGTDLSEVGIDRARLGVYSSAIEKDVSPARLTRFFKKLDSTYQINRMVRDICTFARQNITADPPFSRLDLISCRNVLIYLGPNLQKRCLPIFHYALNPGGYLMLGPSETVGPFSDMFELMDKRAKIYAKKLLPGRVDVDFRPYAGGSELKTLEPAEMAPASDGGDFSGQVQKVADRILLGTYAPAGVVIDSNMNVRQFRGKTSPFLEHAPGPATLNLLHMARPALVPDLRATIHRAMKTGQPTRKERAVMKYDSTVIEVNIEVVPFKVPTSESTWMLVIFDRLAPDKRGGSKKHKRVASGRHDDIEQLREELSATKESLQAIIEEQEATNEELKSANEEIESSNEELQSTNEELETAKEELQSTNEELTTLNEELSTRNGEMIQVNSDLNNLLSSVQIPIVMVDGALMVRRATPAAAQVFNIREADIGRRLSELNPTVEIDDLDALLGDVIETLSIREKKVADRHGREFLLRIRPYRTADNKIDGAVLTLLDLTETKKSKRGK